MDAPRTTAWIFYALAMASGREAADFDSISEIADGINHAVPTHKEMQSSIAWLTNNGLVSKATQKKYVLTSNGRTVFTAAQEDVTTIFQVWERLTHQFERSQSHYA